MMLHKRQSIGARKVSPPQPTCMTDEQKASYLANLRNNRPARPTGSRPLPTKSSTTASQNDTTLIPRSGSAMSFAQGDTQAESGKNMWTSHSISKSSSMDTLKGRPLAQPPREGILVVRGRKISPTAVITPSHNTDCHDSTARQLEKHEAHTLRKALEKIDLEDEEVRIYSAAQMEAANLVWKHRNPQLAEHEKVAAYRNPDLDEKQNGARKGPIFVNQQRIDHAESHAEDVSHPHNIEVKPLRLFKRGSREIIDGQLPASNSMTGRRRSSGNRVLSSGSSKGVFSNPDDQIYEEPEEVEAPQQVQPSTQELPLRTRPSNSVPRGSRPLPGKGQWGPTPIQSKIDRFEIYKNSPTQSRNAEYTKNNPVPEREATPEIETPKGRAMEIRSEEIRAATSMKKKDRSPKLPTPTAVSDRPGRPIVSFDPAWKVGNDSPKSSLDMERPSLRPISSVPTMTVSAPAVPTINLPEDEPPNPTIVVSSTPSIPTINLPDEEPEQNDSVVPTINLPEDDTPSRPLPIAKTTQDNKPKPRPLPSHTQSLPPTMPSAGSGRPHNRIPWLSRSPTTISTTGSTVTCNACELPIAGRIVTAAGASKSGQKARFHPECFTCSQCSTPLECVSFYPEPEASRYERLGISPNDNESGQFLDDNTDLRFFCHLDYHEYFSPRCASCKTPIEGAVVLAAGKAWHEGHFFCSECGDPFSSSSPFVESNGYAYCVPCHTRRTSSRCRACKKQILDELTVEALGGKWHDECFNCDECHGDFGDEGKFYVREIEVELTEKEKRKGLSAKKVEERAVCEGCEARRLKGWEVDSFL